MKTQFSSSRGKQINNFFSRFSPYRDSCQCCNTLSNIQGGTPYPITEAWVTRYRYQKYIVPEKKVSVLFNILGTVTHNQKQGPGGPLDFYRYILLVQIINPAQDKNVTKRMSFLMFYFILARGLLATCVWVENPIQNFQKIFKIFFYHVGFH